MARAGSFGTGLSPFGSGTLGGLGQYNIGSDLADLSVYQTTVAWGNGQASDADYIAALRAAVAAADPSSQKYYSAQNTLDDAIYRIGRSDAESAGLDALIAFDQQAIGTMSPDNLRYRDVNDSLQTELAQRRSRDYGVLVDAYNAGSLPTQALLDWVDRTLGTINADSPDYANWTNVKGDLGDRIVGEKDTAVYQDFQRGRMTSADFLTYITARRDSYNPTSPKGQEWAAKVEDATAQIKAAAQSAADSAFFAAYEEGHKSDASYLLYLRRRIDGMTPDDPALGEWQHRLNQAVFSTAEDKLRFDAERATAKVDTQRVYVKAHEVATGATTKQVLVNGVLTTVAVPAGTRTVAGRWTTASGSTISAAQGAMSKLMDFYTGYRATLNPASAEWRTVTRSIDSLAKSEASFAQSTAPTGGGSSGGAGRGAAAAATGPGPSLAASMGTYSGNTGQGTPGKVISSRYSLSNILGLFSVNPTAKKKDVAAAKAFLSENLSTLNNALTRGDDVWLFQDPRTPGSLVTARNPDGSPQLNKNGDPILVRGSAYLPVTSEAFSNFKSVQASNLLAAGEVALARGDNKGFADLTRQAGEALDAARLADAQYRSQNFDDWYKATTKAVDQATMAGDYGAALRLSTDLAKRLAGESQNPYLDDTRRAKLDEIGQKLADSKLMPTTNPDGSVVEGAVNLSELSRGNVVLNPGWHHVLKSNDRGQPAWGPAFDAKQDGSWEASHVTVHTALGNQLVTGEATISARASIDVLVVVQTPDGYRTIPMPDTTRELTFVDEHGLVQRAYSIDDGRTWIHPDAGMPAPTVVINANLRQQKDENGLVTIADADTGDIVFTQKPDGSWSQSAGYFHDNPAAKSWYGQAAWEQAKLTPAGHQQSEFDLVQEREARRANIVDAARMPMGGPNQHMTLAITSPSGVVNFAPPDVVRADYLRSDTRSEAARARQAAGETPRVNPATGFVTGGLSPTVNAATGFVTSGRTFSSQLPADTPPRYQGGARPPAASLTVQIGPSTTMPGLTPNLTGAINAPPALRPAAPSPVYSGNTGAGTPAKVVPPKPTTTPSPIYSGNTGKGTPAKTPAKPPAPPKPPPTPIAKLRAKTGGGA